MKLSAWDPDLRSLVERIASGDIDLQPDFQRQEVWPIVKKKRLIDTIIRQWSIPPIHLIVTRDNSLEVLDGQQRLASIRDFFADAFAIDGNVAPRDNVVEILHGQYYSQLPQNVRRQFDQYTLRGFRITDYLPDEPSELFYRLNQPTALTAGERRNALYGLARDQLKYFIDEFRQAGASKSSIGFSNSRLAYDDVFARLAFFLEIGNIKEKATEATISDLFRSPGGLSGRTLSRISRAIQIFGDQIRTSSFFKLNKASLLSWLILFCRDGASDLDKSFMFAFDQAEANLFGDHLIELALRVFRDRSSLRVTDTSSVVYRDFCLCYAYFCMHDRTIPLQVNKLVLSRAYDLAKLEKRLSFEEIIELSLEQSNWGALP